MYRLTDIISKPVVSISEGKQIGTAESAVFSKSLSKLTHISVFDLELEDKVYIPSSCILSMEKEAIMVKGSCTADPPPEDNCPINAPVYDEEGGLLGRTTDILLDNDFAVTEIDISEGGKLSPKNIISYSKHTIIACFDIEKAKKLKKLRTPAKKAKKEPQENVSSLQDTITQVMELLPFGLSAAGSFFSAAGESGQEGMNSDFNIGNQAPAEDLRTEDEPPEDFPEQEIRKIVPPFNYLIGRKVTSDLYGVSDKPIIKKDSIITAKDIDICRRYGKLIALAKNSRPV